MRRLIHLILPLIVINLVATETRKRALIFGITGQDGSYLAELLISKGYEVHGVKRYHSACIPSLIDELQVNLHGQGRDDLILHWGDLTDFGNIVKLVCSIKPDEIYNLGALSHVHVSFSLPEYAANCDALGVLRILEAIRLCGLTKSTRFYQASTSELFGKTVDLLQSERSILCPQSPYASAKLYAFWTTKNYREAYNMFACNGILFNHESERRPEMFISRKITLAVARIKHDLQSILYIGNLDAKRDWGYAPDYVEAMWLMLQHEKPDDYVIATGETHSVREFIEIAFRKIGINIIWEGSGVNEIGYDAITKNILVKVAPEYFRPLEVQFLCGDASKANRILNWYPKKKFADLVSHMLDYDLNIIAKQVA